MKIHSLTVLGVLAPIFAGTSYGAIYMQNFTAPNGTVNGGLGDGSFIASDIDNGNLSSGAGPGGIQNNALLLTSAAVGGTRSSFRTPALANSALGWTATFSFVLTDTAGGNAPADGFSFSYGAIPNFVGTSGQLGNGPLTDPNRHGQAEEGWGAVQHISFEVDTWQVGDAEHGFNIAGNIGGVQQDFAFLNTDIITDGQSVSGTATLSWSPTNGASLSTTLTGPVFTNVATPGFVGNNAYVFAFGARTGGATEDVIIDNLNITSVPEPTGIALLGGGLLSLILRRRRSA
jgi:hypothetical protein